jgi:hypothetical protein
MDIKDGSATSSNEHLRSLIRVHELDEITSNAGEDLLTVDFGTPSYEFTVNICTYLIF